MLWGVDAAVSWNDPEFLAGRTPLEVVMESMRIMTEIAFRLCAERREQPEDDLITDLVQADVDGTRLTDAEIGAFLVLLSVAGNDTTRHTTSHAHASAGGLSRPAGTPDGGHRRPHRPGGRGVRPLGVAGDDVSPHGDSGHRDRGPGGGEGGEGRDVLPVGEPRRVGFERPNEFDIARDPNRHVGFGGGGPHFCMGAALARMQLKTIFTELLGRFPELEAGQPTYVVGNFVNGVAQMPFSTGRAA